MTDTTVEQKLKQIFDRGLSSGLGTAGGTVCIEAAICEALGEPHSDKPSCVHEIDRALSFRLNAGPWSSEKARAEGMWPLALPQLGTAGKDRKAFLNKVVEGTIRRIVPIALRATAKVHTDEKHRSALEAAAVRCENEGTLADADAAAYAAYAAANAAANAADADAAYAAANAAANAADAAANAAYYAANAAYAAANAAYAADAAANAAYAAALAAANAAFAAPTDEVLREMVAVTVDAYNKEKETV